MQCALKLAAALLVVLGTLASGEEVEVTTATVEENAKQQEVDEAPKDDEGGAKGKRGLFRVTGVHGENLQPYHFFYTVPQQTPAAYQHPTMGGHHYEQRSVGSVPATTLVKPYPMPYAQPTYQQPYVFTNPSPAPIPYNGAASTMILLMMPPHPGNPLGSLMLVPYNNVMPQHLVQGRVPIQLVPQYVPVPVKGYGQIPAAHFKTSEYSQKPILGSQYLSGPEYSQKASLGPQYLSGSEYSQKPLMGSQYLSGSEYTQKPLGGSQYLNSGPEYAQKASLSPQYLSSSEYAQKPSLSSQYLSSQYQEQASSSEEQDSGATSPPSYARRPVEYVKG